MEVIGKTTSETLTGTTAADVIIAKQGGDDSITALAGDDIIGLGEKLDVNDTIDGGDGYDKLYFTDKTSAATDLDHVTNVEKIILGDATTTITTKNSLVSSGSTLEVKGDAMTSNLTFNGSAETDGNFSIWAGQGNDQITVGGGDDIVVIKQGGNDKVSLGGGDDVIGAGQSLTTSDTIDGGAGNDVLYFKDTTTQTTDLDHVTNVETIVLGDAETTVVTKDDLVASGKTLTVDGSRLVNHAMNWDGSNETDGSFAITSGAGNDTIKGGSKNDTIDAGAGDDTITDGAGNDTVYARDGADSIDATGGGNDFIRANAGDDTVNMGTKLTSADTVNGGYGNDKLIFTDNNNASDDLDNVMYFETIQLGNTTSNVDIKLPDAIVLPGSTLVIDASSLTTGTLTLDASSETDSNLKIVGGSKNDTISMGTGLTSADTIDGGTQAAGGADVLNYTDKGTGTDELDHVTGIESIVLGDAETAITTVDDLVSATIDANIDLNIDGSNLGSSHTLTFDASAEKDADIKVMCGAGADSITVGAGNDSVDDTSGAGNDVIIAKLGGKDTINAGDGNDTIGMGRALDTNDTIDGGAGTDVLYFTDTDGAVTDLNGVTNIESIVLGDATTSVTAQNNLVATGATLTVDASNLTSTHTLTWDGSAEGDGKFNIIGGNGADTITGGDKADTINGGLGADEIRGMDGDDSLDGGAGNDTIVFDDNTKVGDDTINGGDGTDVLKFEDGAGATTYDIKGASISNIETIFLNDDAQNITVQMGADDISGQSITLKDTDGATTTLQIEGTSSGDTIDLSNVTQDSTSPVDSLVVKGLAGKDNITGSAFADSIEGGTGADTISGGSGNDTILGGAGADSITTGDGADKVVLDHFATVDNITDFTSGTDGIYFDFDKGGATSNKIETAGKLGTKLYSQGNSKINILTTAGGTDKVLTLAKTLDKDSGTVALTAKALFTGYASKASLTAAIKSQANKMAAISAGGAITAHSHAVAFGVTTKSHKLYVFAVSDTKAATGSGGKIAQTLQVATLAANPVATDIHVF